MSKSYIGILEFKDEQSARAMYIVCQVLGLYGIEMSIEDTENSGGTFNVPFAAIVPDDLDFPAYIKHVKERYALDGREMSYTMEEVADE